MKSQNNMMYYLHKLVHINTIYNPVLGNNKNMSQELRRLHMFSKKMID